MVNFLLSIIVVCNRCLLLRFVLNSKKKFKFTIKFNYVL